MPIRPSDVDIFIVQTGREKGFLRQTAEYFNPEFLSTTKTIFVRATGNDISGDGVSPNTPYRTFQRAIQDVPAIIPPGKSYVIDVTDLGTEVLPVDYQLPIIQGTYLGGFASSGPFTLTHPFEIRATPKRAAILSAADAAIAPTDIASVTANADTGLATLTINVPRASWAADALKGYMIMGTAAPAGAAASCVIRGSTNTTLLLCNTSASVPAGGAYQIVEPSCTFEGPGANLFDFCAMNFLGIKSSWGLKGIKIRATDGVTYAANLGGESGCLVAWELCDIAGLGIEGSPLQFLTLGCVFRTLDFGSGTTAITPRRSLFLNIPFFLFQANTAVSFRQCAFDSCPYDLGPDPLFGSVPIGPGWEFLNCIFTSCGASRSISFRSVGSLSLSSVQINSSPGDAIYIEGPSKASLTRVTGTLNVGFGIQANDGAVIRVTDDNTVITGTAGDMKIGTLAVRTWANFRGAAPTKNQHDLQVPIVGDEVTGAGTGGPTNSRMFQR